MKLLPLLRFESRDGGFKRDSSGFKRNDDRDSFKKPYDRGKLKQSKPNFKYKRKINSIGIYVIVQFK